MLSLITNYPHRRILVNLETIEKKNYTKGRGHMCPSDGFVCFRNSELLTGRLGKATLGDGNKDGLFHVRLLSELRLTVLRLFTTMEYHGWTTYMQPNDPAQLVWASQIRCVMNIAVYIYAGAQLRLLRASSRRVHEPAGQAERAVHRRPRLLHRHRRRHARAGAAESQGTPHGGRVRMLSPAP